MVSPSPQASWKSLTVEIPDQGPLAAGGKPKEEAHTALTHLSAHNLCIGGIMLYDLGLSFWPCATWDPKIGVGRFGWK